MSKQETQERIVCSAIWYKEQPTAKILPNNVERGVVVCGHRHPHCIHTFVALTGKRSVEPECGEYEQGFLTSRNRFFSREAAMAIARERGQLIRDTNLDQLYSEDIY